MAGFAAGKRAPVRKAARPVQVELPYTVERANRTLPLVRRIVDDLMACHTEWQDAVSRFEYATTKSRAEAPDPDAARLEAEAQALAEQVEGYVAELAELGLECRAYETGLIDFPGELDGRPVFFCWMRSEPSVQHWHEVGAGFSGRQQLHDSEMARP